MHAQGTTFSDIASREARYTLIKMLVLAPVGALIFNINYRNQQSEPMKGMAFTLVATAVNGLVQTLLDYALVKYADASKQTLENARTYVMFSTFMGTALLFNYLGFQVVGIRRRT